MSKNKKSRSVLISILTSIALALSGCGGAGNNSSASTFTVNGVVSDGAINGAEVWLDLVENGIRDASEPFALSDAEGNFRIDTVQNIASNIVIKAMGGVDTGTNLPFEGFLEAKSVADTDKLTQMLTPLTTLKAKGDLKDDDIRQMFPDLPVGDIDKMNPNIHKEFERVGMIVHSTIAQLTKATKSSVSTAAIDDVYKQFVDEFSTDMRQGTFKFEELPLDRIIQKGEEVMTAEKASAIQSMIMDTTKQMLDLDLTEIDNDEKLKEFQIFAMRDAHEKIDKFQADELDKQSFLEQSKQVRNEMINKRIQDVMSDRSEQIKSIREQMTNDIKSNLNLDDEVLNSDTANNIEQEISNDIIAQVEQSILQDVESQINDNFIHSNTVKGIVNEDKIKEIKNKTMEDMMNRFGDLFKRR